VAIHHDTRLGTNAAPVSRKLRLTTKVTTTTTRAPSNDPTCIGTYHRLNPFDHPLTDVNSDASHDGTAVVQLAITHDPTSASAPATRATTSPRPRRRHAITCHHLVALVTWQPPRPLVS
jgi:hypothetical protein